jgi:hypothetical protein
MIRRWGDRWVGGGMTVFISTGFVFRYHEERLVCTINVAYNWKK